MTLTDFISIQNSWSFSNQLRQCWLLHSKFNFLIYQYDAWASAAVISRQSKFIIEINDWKWVTIITNKEEDYISLNTWPTLTKNHMKNLQPPPGIEPGLSMMPVSGVNTNTKMWRKSWYPKCPASSILGSIIWKVFLIISCQSLKSMKWHKLQ